MTIKNSRRGLGCVRDKGGVFRSCRMANLLWIQAEDTIQDHGCLVCSTEERWAAETSSPSLLLPCHKEMKFVHFTEIFAKRFHLTVIPISPPFPSTVLCLAFACHRPSTWHMSLVAVFHRLHFDPRIVVWYINPIVLHVTVIDTVLKENLFR